MNDREHAAARLGLRALDGALTALGLQPVHENPDLRWAEPVVLDIPNVVLEKTGVAPLRFVLGPDLDVWVGPFSEVVVLPVTEATTRDNQQQIEQILTSSVVCRRGRWSQKIAFHGPDERPWRPLTSYGGMRRTAPLEPVYAPYVMGGTPVESR